MARARTRSKPRKRDAQRRRPTARDAMAARPRKGTAARSPGKTVPTRRVPRDLAAETDEEPMGGVRQEPRTRRRAAVDAS